MSADWVGVLITFVATVGAAGWAVWTWASQRKADRLQERRRVDSLYVNPMLFAAQDLQSRLFNLLERDGLIPLRERDPAGGYAVETVYLLARYLAWEQLLLRFTNFASDARVVRLTQQIREVLASDRDGVDPWCLFRPTQTALGQEVTVWRQGEVGFADSLPLVDFEKKMKDGLAADLHLDDAVLSLQRASDIKDLDLRSRQRLAEVQSVLVDLLEHVETALTTDEATPFSVAPDYDRLRARIPQGQ
jgi:hypothetical protein